MAIPLHSPLPDNNLPASQLFKGLPAEDFSKFYDQYAPLLFGMLMRKTNNQEEAEELLQICFITLWKHRITCNVEPRSVFSWILRTLQASGIQMNILSVKLVPTFLEKASGPDFPPAIQNPFIL